MKKSIIKAAFAALFLLAAPQVKAQSLSDILSGVAEAANKVTGANAATEKTITGTWKYQSPTVEFESADVLKNLGGTALSKKINAKLLPVMTKAGLKKGTSTFTFNSDKTFKYKVSAKNTGSGTWSLSGSTLTLKYTTYLKQEKSITATAVYDGATLKLLFDAKKLMTFINSVGTTAANYSSTIKTINTLVGSYDGMKVGLSFKK